MTRFRSAFADRLNAYVKLRRSLGVQFLTQAAILKAFDRYAHEHDNANWLTQELAMDFATSNTHVSQVECARRYHVVRHFSEYLGTFEPNTPLLDPKAMRCPRSRPPVHIYTEDELVGLLNECRRISRNPIRGMTLRSMVGLAASAGLRISEVVRLDKSDVDLVAGILTIRQTKFSKDRLVPVHSTTRDVLEQYSRIRDAAFQHCPCPAFFINQWRRRFSKHTVQLAFWDLTRRLGLRGDKGLGPRFHDLRHTFAVHRLMAWYQEGADVQAMLPALATYMGHAHYSDTAYYLKATPELLALAAGRRESTQREGNTNE